MKHIRIALSIIIALSGILLIYGCSTDTPNTTNTPAPKKREPVHSVECTRPTSISGLYPAGGTQIIVCRTDYEAEVTTVQIVDIVADTVCGEIVLDGVWSLKEQTFSDKRIVLCDHDENRWKFRSSSLTEIGTLETENVDGFFSYDGKAYYYLSENVLCRRDIDSDEVNRVTLSPDLRFLGIEAFDSKSGQMILKFFLSPYSSECGTAILDVGTGEYSMLQSDRYQAVFTDQGVCLMAFSDQSMGYTVSYGNDDGDFMFIDTTVFMDSDDVLYAISGAPYLMVVSESSTLYTLAEQVRSCSLSDYGISGEMHSFCWLPGEGMLAGAVYGDEEFRLYAIDIAQLSFTDIADAAHIPSPLTVDGGLAPIYWREETGETLAADLQENRKYADTLEEKYGVRILISSQCEGAAALCEYDITLTDSMGTNEEVRSTRIALDCLSSSLALYPSGFLSQFKNGMGEGGVRFLLVGQIDSGYGTIGCTYESGSWQNIAIDVRMADSLDGIICHEMWHATENHILSYDYTAFSRDKWSALNPEGFSYYGNAALSDPNQQRWTLYGSGDEGVYFVDSYARVNEMEDRARIMEYFMTREDEAKVLIQSPAIRQKLMFMCGAVRDCFDTTGWGSVKWEELL